MLKSWLKNKALLEEISVNLAYEYLMFINELVDDGTDCLKTEFLDKGSVLADVIIDKHQQRLDKPFLSIPPNYTVNTTSRSLKVKVPGQKDKRCL